MSKTRTKNVRISQKGGDTIVKTIEQQYKLDLGYRSDAKLSTVLKKEGMDGGDFDFITPKALR
jgi:hypothetical protein